MARWIIAAGLVAIPGLVRADTGEWRVGAGGGGTLVSAGVGGGTGTGLGLEAHARLGYSLANPIEIGLVGSYAHASDVAFASGLDAQGGTLFADLTTIALAADLRWTPGIGLAR